MLLKDRISKLEQQTIAQEAPSFFVGCACEDCGELVSWSDESLCGEHAPVPECATRIIVDFGKTRRDL